MTKLETKKAVLAKCGAETANTNWAAHNDLDWDLRRDDDDEFVLDGWGGSVSCAFSDKDADDSEVWVIAAQILGIAGEPQRPSNDQRTVRDMFEDQDLERELLNSGFIYTEIEALKRLAGMEVPRG